MPRKAKEKIVENEVNIEKKDEKKTTKKAASKPKKETVKKVETKSKSKAKTEEKISPVKKVATKKAAKTTSKVEATAKTEATSKATDKPKKTATKAVESKAKNTATKKTTSKTAKTTTTKGKTASKSSKAEEPEKAKKTSKTTTKTAVKKETKKASKTSTSLKKASESKKAEDSKTKKASSTEKKSTTRKRATSKKASETDIPNIQILEYYDLPYKYGNTIVKLLAQTPKTLFVYWEISDEDINNFKQKYGEDFFNITKPILIVHNLTLNKTNEIEINDFANCWYLNTEDSDCKYDIELARKFIKKVTKPTKASANEYLYVAKSNILESPNDHIMFEKLTETITFRNYKTNEIVKEDFKSFKFLKDIYKFYQNMYTDELLKNPSSKF